jgi:hypothetical protein
MLREVFARRRAVASRSRIEPSTQISVRTNERIDADRRVTQVYTAAVDQEVHGDNGQLAIPRGSPVELMIREAPDHDLILDLESVTVNGQRYALEAQSDRIESERRAGAGENRRTAEHVGGGAVLGAIIGAIAGGARGAAIGAGAGAAAGAGVQVMTRGRAVHVPPESILTFRLDQPLVVGVPDRGVDRYKSTTMTTITGLAETDTDRVDSLIAELEHSGETRHELLLEHLRSARAYLLGAMPEEYALNLELAKLAAHDMPETGLRERVMHTISDWLSEATSKSRDRQVVAHHLPPAERDIKPNSRLARLLQGSRTLLGIFYPKYFIVAVFRSLETAQSAPRLCTEPTSARMKCSP